MTDIRVFLIVVLAFFGASAAYSAPTIKQCEPEFSTFLKVFGTAYQSGSVLTDPVEQYECSEVKASQALKERKDWVLIDNRSKHEFDALHIPGSLNVIDTTRAISHLKSQKILLINKGSRRSASLQLCHDMMVKGFNQVSILEDGLNGWIASGAPYNGNVTGLRELFLLTEREVTYLLHHDQIQILFIESTSNQQAANTLLHQHAHAFSSNQTSDVFHKLSQLGTTHDLPVLMVSDGSQNDDIIDRYMTAKNANVYFLANGASGLDRFYHNWKNSLASKSASNSLEASCL